MSWGQGAQPSFDPVHDDPREGSQAERDAALRDAGYDPALPVLGIAGPPGVVLAVVPSRYHVCQLDGVEIDGHERSDLDIASTACLHCQFEGSNP